MRVTLVTPEAATGFFLEVVSGPGWPPAEIIIIIINNKEVRFFLFLCLIGTLVGRGGRAARGLAEARNKIFIYRIL